ncbi:unnamed protein product [Pedinophyceae sp. YPF-701]|nr:unnamed protein product [Pedinophyceae sp. YPF-701]
MPSRRKAKRGREAAAAPGQSPSRQKAQPSLPYRTQLTQFCDLAAKYAAHGEAEQPLQVRFEDVEAAEKEPAHVVCRVPAARLALELPHPVAGCTETETLEFQIDGVEEHGHGESRNAAVEAACALGVQALLRSPALAGRPAVSVREALAQLVEPYCRAVSAVDLCYLLCGAAVGAPGAPRQWRCETLRACIADGTAHFSDSDDAAPTRRAVFPIAAFAWTKDGISSKAVHRYLYDRAGGGGQARPAPHVVAARLARTLAAELAAPRLSPGGLALQRHLNLRFLYEETPPAATQPGSVDPASIYCALDLPAASPLVAEAAAGGSVETCTAVVVPSDARRGCEEVAVRAGHGWTWCASVLCQGRAVPTDVAALGRADRGGGVRMPEWADLTSVAGGSEGGGGAAGAAEMESDAPGEGARARLATEAEGGVLRGVLGESGAQRVGTVGGPSLFVYGRLSDGLAAGAEGGGRRGYNARASLLMQREVFGDVLVAGIGYKNYAQAAADSQTAVLASSPVAAASVRLPHVRLASLAATPAAVLNNARGGGCFLLSLPGKYNPRTWEGPAPSALLDTLRRSGLAPPTGDPSDGAQDSPPDKATLTAMQVLSLQALHTAETTVAATLSSLIAGDAVAHASQTAAAAAAADALCGLTVNDDAGGAAEHAESETVRDGDLVQLAYVVAAPRRTAQHLAHLLGLEEPAGDAGGGLVVLERRGEGVAVRAVLSARDADGAVPAEVAAALVGQRVGSVVTADLPGAAVVLGTPLAVPGGCVVAAKVVGVVRRGAAREDGPRALFVPPLGQQRLAMVAERAAARARAHVEAGRAGEEFVVVDVGCRDGGLLVELLERTAAVPGLRLRYLGVDSSARGLAGLRKRVARLAAQQNTPLTDLPPDAAAPPGAPCWHLELPALRVAVLALHADLRDPALRHMTWRTHPPHFGAMVEVIEHVPPRDLRVVEEVLFGARGLRPSELVVTTPNQEYNATLWGGEEAARGRRRDDGHFFEWTRAECAAWAARAAARWGRAVAEHGTVGRVQEAGGSTPGGGGGGDVGGASQYVVFRHGERGDAAALAASDTA